MTAPDTAPGTVWFAVVCRDGEEAREEHLPGGPEQVVSEATHHALGLLRVATEAASRSRS